MTQFWRNSLEVAAAIGTIMLGTIIVHVVMSWWSASAAFHYVDRRRPAFAAHHSP